MYALGLFVYGRIPKGGMMIICGDALTELRKLAAESIHCCITSPPYYGLRDYGTAVWEGGDPKCDHRRIGGGTRNKGRNRAKSGGTFHDSPIVEIALGVPFKEICLKCGAHRIDFQLGLEKTPEEYVQNLVAVFREVRRVLRKDGTLWLVIGDSYNANGRKGHGIKVGYKQGTNRASSSGEDHVRSSDPGLKPKDLVGVPWRVAFALQADGWWIRQDIIWSKPNPMPESVTDRCTKAHEYVFMLSKAARYYYDAEAVKEEVTPGCYRGPRREGFKADKKVIHKNDSGVHCSSHPALGRNRRSVWTVTTKSFKEAHFATFPPDLVEPMIKAGCPKGGTILDPFFGAGTVGFVALRYGREFIGIELNRKYCEIARRRLYGPLVEGGGDVPAGTGERREA